MTAQAKALPSVLWSEESEQIVLGGMMLDQALAHDLYDIVAPEQFFSQQHRAIARTIITLIERGIPADAVSVFTALGTADRSLAPYLHTCSRAVPYPASALHHARIVVERADRRRMWESATAVTEALERGQDAAPALEALRDPLTGPLGDARASKALLGASRFLYHEETGPSALWGVGSEVLWEAGEPLVIVGATGVGKGTLVQRLALARGGVGEKELLGLTVEADDRPTLYIAADRPRQIRRSMRRMLSEAEAELLDQRFLFWRGPLEFDISQEPERLARWAKKIGTGTLVIDSLKDVALELSKDDAGGRTARALQWIVAEGIEVVAVHHRRKAPADGQGRRAKASIDDVFGSQLITAVAGSVIFLDGNPGDAYVQLRHLKQPAGEVGPLRLYIDLDAGTIRLDEETRSPQEYLRAAHAGLTAKEAARIFFGTEDPDKGQEAKARRRLGALEDQGLAYRRHSERSAPDRWFATAREVSR